VVIFFQNASDELSRSRPAFSRDRAHRLIGDDVPTLAHIRGIKLVMYYEDHEPPHCHARSPDFSAKFAISDLSVLELAGKLKPRESALIKRWALANRPSLLENWRRAQRGEAMVKLEDSEP
jgi:Domain of unknown function (DUF4160)